jgi:hypothetical protein
MGRAKDDSYKSDEEKLPEWAEHEIRSVQFAGEEVLSRTGYILDTYKNDDKIDIQLYEALPDNRTIIEGLDIPNYIRFDDFKKGFVYEFKIKMFKGSLSSRLVDLLRKRFSLDMDAIYRFELKELQPMEVESDASPAAPKSGTGDDTEEV